MEKLGNFKVMSIQNHVSVLWLRDVKIPSDIVMLKEDKVMVQWWLTMLHMNKKLKSGVT